MMDCRNPNEIIAGEIESWRSAETHSAARHAANRQDHGRRRTTRRTYETSDANSAGREPDRRSSRQRPSKVPEIKFDSVPNALQLPAGHLSRRSGRRRDQFARRYFCLHAHRPPHHHDRHRASLRPRRLAAVSIRPQRRSSSAKSARTPTASCSPRRSASIPTTTSGWWIK